VRETIARATPEALRRRIHLAAVLHYRGVLSGVPEERRVVQLAYHAGEAGMPLVAARHYLDLAEQARARDAYPDAERLYTRALEQPAGTEGMERAAAYRGRGLMRYRICRYHDALADFSCARDLAGQAGGGAALVEILLDEATALDWMDDYATSEERVKEAHALTAQGSSPLLDARLLLGLGRSAFRSSRNDLAARLLEQAVAKAEPLGDEGYETRVIALFMLGFILPGLSRLGDARAALDRSITLADEHGDRLHLGSALNVRGMLAAGLGDKAGLVADMERSVSLARELGQVTLELKGEFNVAEYLLLLDDAAAAEPHFRRAQALDRRITGDPGLANVALLDARLHFYRGEHAQAAAIVARLRARQCAARDGGEPDTLLVPSDEVLCSMIELSVAGAGAAAWDALEERSERFSTAEERLEVIEARAVAAATEGRVVEARAHLERALARAKGIPSALRARLGRRLAELGRGRPTELGRGRPTELGRGRPAELGRGSGGPR
jgi:tetratricopeptide (TPR) repeat protein